MNEDPALAVVSELLDETTLAAFRAAWPRDAQVAAAEARSIAELLTQTSSNEYNLFISQLSEALVGSLPDLLAWLTALTDEGRFELQRPTKRAKEIPGPSRAIQSRLNRLDNQQRRTGADASSPKLEKQLEAIRMLTAATLVSKLRESIRAKAAIGSGWTIMHAISESGSADLQRRLHQFGDDRGFRDAIVAGVQDAVDSWAERNFGPHVPRYEHTAAWKRSLPVGISPVTYFTDQALNAYRNGLFARLKLKPPTALVEAGNTTLDADALAITSQFSTEQNQKFSYLTRADGQTITSMQYSEESVARLRELMPILSEKVPDDVLAAAGHRSLARSQARYERKWRNASEHGDELQTEIRRWVEAGYGPPPHLRVCDASFFEEEACYYYLEWADKWTGLEEWQQLGFFPEANPRIGYIYERESRLGKGPDI